MFIGHFAVAMGAKRLAPSTSLGTLFLATQLLDLIWPTFLLLGIERVRIVPGITAVAPFDFIHYPYSHSLLFALLWAVVLGLVYLKRKRVPAAAAVVGVVVFSHWLLDFITHRPDLPLTPFSEAKVGLGLWYSLPTTLIIESAMFFGALFLYVKTTRARSTAGSAIFWSLVVFLVVIHIGNYFGPPPPNVNAIAVAGHALWLLVAWAYWADSKREVSMGDHLKEELAG